MYMFNSQHPFILLGSIPNNYDDCFSYIWQDFERDVLFGGLEFQRSVLRYSLYTGPTGSEGRKEVFYLTKHSTVYFLVIWHRIYGIGYMVKNHSISEKGNCFRHYMGYSFRLAARYILYALPSQITYRGAVVFT